jgi:Leucine-rich repeat (LRR) protein
MGSQLSQTLSKLTHLHLNGKRIQIIGEEMEKACKNLKVLYLFDNQIQRIEGLQSMRNLIQLSLYNN